MSSTTAIRIDKVILDFHNLKRFARIFFPLLFLLAFVSITGYVERLLLAIYSTGALTGSLNGFFLARIFQAACISVVVVGQAYVGLYNGSNQLKNIGSCVWQLIWFSIISILFVVPLGFIAEQLLFGDTVLEAEGGNYFFWLCGFNFLYPLGGALSVFYLGRGVTRPVVLLTLGSCLLNVGLDLILIFGFHSIPPMGALGAAIGRVISQAALCLVLFTLFLSRSNRTIFGTNAWVFLPRLFWHYIRPGILRGLGAIPALGDWALVSCFMTLKSEAHLLVFSIGSTIFYLLTCLGDGLFQTMVTMSSNHIGKKEHSTVWTSFSSGLFLLVIGSLLLTIPFFIFPQSLILLFRDIAFYPQVVEMYHSVSHWIWLAIIAYALNTISLGIIVASRDSLFLLGFYCIVPLMSLAPIYITMNILGWTADKFWVIVMATNLVACGIFLWRASKERWKVDNWQPKLPAAEMNPSLPSSV